MNKNNCVIRKEMPSDYATVENLVRESFSHVYRPGCVEHYVLKHLRQTQEIVSELDFVLEMDG
jgi:predicted N-acetyltransferase YhbS